MQHLRNLAKILLQKFPDVEKELKAILPPSTFSKLVPNPATTPKEVKTPSQPNLPKPQKTQSVQPKPTESSPQAPEESSLPSLALRRS